MRVVSAPKFGWWTWALLVAVLSAAAVLSFDALRDLAVLCAVDPRLAPLLPVAIDAGAALSTRVWLDGRAALAERFARRMTFAMLAVTVAGNALHSGLVASGLTPTWWTAVLVGAVPPAVVGATVHLAVLVGRQGDTDSPQAAVTAAVGAAEGAGAPRTLLGTGSETARTLSGDSTRKGPHLASTPAAAGPDPVTAADQGWELSPTPDGDQGYTTAGTPAPGSNQVQPGPTVDDRAAALIAEGAGRRRLARELGMTEYEARGLLGHARNGASAGAP